MRILSKYIARKFWGPFIFIICIFAALIFLGDSLEKMRWISTYNTTLSLVLKYTLLTMPSWLLQVLPVACLLSALFVISDMISSGEWTACLAGGFTVRQIFKPIIACIFLVALLGFAAQELLVPNMNKHATITLQRSIRGKTDWQFNVQNDVTLRLNSQKMLFAKTVRPADGIMEGMFIDLYDNSHALSSQISARYFRWDPRTQRWIFEDGLIRDFGKNATVKEKPFEQLVSDFSMLPDQIAVGQADSTYLTIRDLIKRIKFLEASGLKTFQERTFLNAKLAAPFATVIMCLLGMPLAIAVKRSSKLLNIVAAIAIGFSFWWIVSMLSSAGQSGMINPILAGWLPVGLFAAIAYAEFKLLKI
ncbi:MAG: LptF/LptG family permease [Elusimicrobiota bacterium]|jgi:lipopolysaccharide export system permease protein|nr:LptF/LptG family permease [Elusimicrobiota bacterium]